MINVSPQKMVPLTNAQRELVKRELKKLVNKHGPAAVEIAWETCDKLQALPSDTLMLVMDDPTPAGFEAVDQLCLRAAELVTLINEVIPPPAEDPDEDGDEDEEEAEVSATKPPDPIFGP